VINERMGPSALEETSTLELQLSQLFLHFYNYSLLVSISRSSTCWVDSEKIALRCCCWMLDVGYWMLFISLFGE